MIWHNWNVIWLLLIDEPILIGGITWTSVTWAFCSFPRAAASSWNECKSRFLLMKCQDIHLWCWISEGPLTKKPKHILHQLYIVTCLYSGGTPEVLECIFCFILFVESISGFLSFKTKRMHLEVWFDFSCGPMWLCALNLHSSFSFSGCSHLWAA